MHLAAESGDLKVIEALSSKKVHWDTEDRYGRTPIEKAVLAGREDVVKALLKAGADPNHRNNYGISPVSRAVSINSTVTKILLTSGIDPDWQEICIPLAVSSPLSQVKALARAQWGAYDVEVCALLGRTDILEYLGDKVRHERLSAQQLLDVAQKSKASFQAYEAEADIPLTVKKIEGPLSEKKGTYILTLPSWSPWMDVDPALKLAKYPVTVYVPKEYDGSAAYGLIISMMNAQFKDQSPNPAYLDTLNKHKLIYVGFDPYNRVFEDGSDDYQFTNHERLCLAAVYHMFGAYNIDRKRVYLTGFSWGGRLTGEIVPKQPHIFTGGLAAGGCFITLTGGRIISSYPYAKRHTVMVLNTGDWDYNRGETFRGYNTFLTLGYEAYFFQEPKKGHTRISGENFEKAISLLDTAALK